MGQITRHFLLSEFVVSTSYPELAAKIEFSPMDEIKLWYLCSTILEPAREKFGCVRILSGKRSPELNKVVKGAAHSDHLFEYVSCAADFALPQANGLGCFMWMQDSLPRAFGQLIWYSVAQFIHVSLPTPKYHGKTKTKME